MAERLSKPPSRRQSQILDLVARGRGDKEIASQLGISVHTVRTHLARIFRDQDVPNRAAAASAWTDAQAEHRPEAAPSSPRRPLQLAGPLALLATTVLVLGGVLAGRTLGIAERPAGHPAASAAAPAGPSLPSSTITATPSLPSIGRGVTPPASRGTMPALPASPARPAPPSPMTTARAELEAINGARAAAGLPPLAWSDCLARSATNAAVALASGAAPATLAAGQCGAVAAGSAVAHLAAPDDTAATTAMLADPVRRAQLLFPGYSHMGAAWAVGASGAYLAIVLD